MRGQVMPVEEQTTHTRISIDNVLFATDFTVTAQSALPYALAICRHYGSTLHAVHVLPEINPFVPAETLAPEALKSGYESARRNATERMMHLSPGLENIPHHIYICRGDIWSVLSHIIGKEHIDLVVLGTHGRDGVGKLMLGSVAEEILRQAPCPVLTVGPRGWGGLKQEFEPNGKDFAPEEVDLHEIVCATSLPPESTNVSGLAFSLAQEFQARLGLLHVIPERERGRTMPTEWALRELGKLIPKESKLWCEPGLIIEFGPTAECILLTAAERKADLIVLGVRSAGPHLGAATHLSGAIAHRVIARARCPVLTIGPAIPNLR
jgi:nucleotide-binding universal stress UspA family protein